MKNTIVETFRWIKCLIFLVLSLPFLLVGAVGVAAAVLAVLVGMIGLLLLFFAGVVKIDGKSLTKCIEDIKNKR